MLVTNALALIMLTLRSANIGLLWMDIVIVLSLCSVDRALCHVVMYYVWLDARNGTKASKNMLQ